MLPHYAILETRATSGMEAPIVQVEVHVTNGLPQFSLVGLPEAAVKESKDRVRSALISSGFQLPPKRITVNLAPADIPKQGSRYDLPIALGILLASQQLHTDKDLTQFEFIGELGLNGEIRRVEGVLPAVLQAKVAGKVLILPRDNLAEAAVIEGAEVLAAGHILDVCAFFTGENGLASCDEVVVPESSEDFSVGQEDIADIQGQFQAKRVLEICASGGHSLLMVGPPGSGKSMLASRLITLLPDLTSQQAMQIATIRSLVGKPVTGETLFKRNLVRPHHTATAPALVGGGSGFVPKPGALSLAHHSVLFLDELPEFNRNVLEALREPLETKKVEISRVNQQVSYPANVQLVCAMNPTPSGYFSDDHLGRCKDTPEQINRYLRKISGPLLDRIDCHLEISPVDFQQLSQTQVQAGETSANVKERVTFCHQRQLNRQGKLNAALTPQELSEWVEPDEASLSLLERSVNQLGMSARSYHKVLRVALTLADMAQEDKVSMNHIAEALSYRKLDKLS